MAFAYFRVHNISESLLIWSPAKRWIKALAAESTASSNPILAGMRPKNVSYKLEFSAQIDIASYHILLG